MNATDQLILLVFKKEPTREFSTSEIIKAVYREEYDPVKDALHRKVDREKKRDAGRKKGELHRRILYHLGKLCQEGIIRVSRATDRGEKIFSLALDPGQYVIEKKERKIVIANPPLPSMEKYHAEGIVLPFEKETMLSRANAILLDAGMLSSKEAPLVFSELNDCLGILHVESLLDGDAMPMARQSIERMLINAEDAKKGITLIVDLGKKAKLAEFLEWVLSQEKKSDVVIRGEVKDFQKNRKVLESVLNSCQLRRKRIFLQNTSVLQAPAIIGDAGLYVFDEKEWQEHGQNARILVMSGMSMEIDLDAFFAKYEEGEFAAVAEHAARSLFLAGRMQRTSHVAPFVDHKGPGPLVLERHYVRLVHEGKDPRIALLLGELRLLSDEFSSRQEYAYCASGLPLRFRLAHGRRRKGEKEVPTIRMIKDIDAPAMSDAIELYLALEEVNKGYDFFHVRMSPQRGGDISPDILSLLSRFEIPVLCIEFSEKRGEVALTQFF